MSSQPTDQNGISPSTLVVITIFAIIGIQGILNWCIKYERDFIGLTFGVMTAVVSLFFLMNFVHTFRQRRWLEDTASSSLASAAQGQAKLSGTAKTNRDGQLLVSPLTHTPCLWYSFQVSFGDEIEEKGQSSTPFFLCDATGETLVSPAGAEVCAKHVRIWGGTTKRPANTVVGGILGHIFGPYQYCEKLILSGDQLLVTGWHEATIPRDETSLLNERLIRLKSNRSELFKQFDKNKDGEIDIDEWDGARTVLQNEIREENLRSPQEEAKNTVSKPQDSSIPFIISAHLEHRLNKLKSSEEIVFVLGFLVMGILSIGFFLRFFMPPK